MVLFFSLCGYPSNYANAATTNTCWYDMKRSKETLNNPQARSTAIEEYNECNANHIREFINETKKKKPNCGNLYKHLMRTDIFWMTRSFMKNVDDNLSKYNKNKTIREYVRNELHRHCVISFSSDFLISKFKEEIQNLSKNNNPEKLGYDHMFNDFNALILNLSPCMSYADKRYTHNPNPSVIRYDNIYLTSYKFSNFILFFRKVEKIKEPNASLLYQSLYNFIDNAKYSNVSIESYYTNACEKYQNIQKQENKSLFGAFLKIQQEIFFIDTQGIYTRVNYPPGYFPGHLPVFYSHMVSLSERSKSNLLNRPNIKPPKMINCKKLITIFNGIQKQRPYSLCNTKKCLAESSREETIWIFLSKLKQILNDTTSYNCGIK
jgi:hypothetical protein